MSVNRFSQIKPILQSRTLPLFVTQSNKYSMGFLLGLLASALYLPTNRFHFFSPQLLPFSWVDYLIPFLPRTVWIYLSEYIFFIAVYFTCKDIINLNKYFYSFLFLQTVSVLIFCFWPTIYPRDMFPLPDELDPLTYFAFSTLRKLDTPASCCPSLHVSSVYLSAFIFLDDQKKKFPFFFLWGTAIAISTLTTKQHYLVDVVIGFIMALACYWFFHRVVQYSNWDSIKQAIKKRSES